MAMSERSYEEELAVQADLDESKKWRLYII